MNCNFIKTNSLQLRNQGFTRLVRWLQPRDFQVGALHYGCAALRLCFPGVQLWRLLGGDMENQVPKTDKIWKIAEIWWKFLSLGEAFVKSWRQGCSKLDKIRVVSFMQTE